MNEELIDMAKQAGLIGMRPHLDGIYIEALEAFAKLVAAAEREACAKVCDDLHPGLANNRPAELIRARGNT